MAGDLTLDANLRFKGEVKTEQFILDTSQSIKVYKGQPMLIDQSNDTENATPFVDAVTVVTTDVFIGIAAEPHNVVSGDPEKEVVNVYVWPTIVGFKMPASTTFTNEDLGKRAAFSGSGTLSAIETATANCEIGTVFTVEDGYVYVALDTPFVQVNA
jgi:hypothetical protein